MTSNRRNKGAQASSSDPSSASSLSITEESLPKDQFSKTRILPITRAEAIPKPPAEFSPLTRDESYGLRSFSEDLQSASLNVVKEIADQGDRAQKVLGPYCPGADNATLLLTRYKDTQQAVRQVCSLLEYLQVQDRINRHDVFKFVSQVKAAYHYHLPFDATLQEQFPAVAHLLEVQSSKISLGLARARKERVLKAQLAEAQKVNQGAGAKVDKKDGGGEGTNNE